MSRLLLWLLIGALVWWGIRRLRQPDQAQPTSEPDQPAATPGDPTATPMVPCAHCGVHLPASDAISQRSPEGEVQHFCSEAHRKLGPRPKR